MLEQQILNAITLGSVYALFALGFTLIFGVLGVINLSHGAMFMLGSYAALQLVAQAEWPLWLALPVAGLLSGLAGLLVDLVVLRPLRRRHAPHLMPMIATIGVTILLTNLMQGIFGAEVQRFPYGTLPEDGFELTLPWADADDPDATLYVTLLQLLIPFCSFALMGVLLWLMRHTRTGRALRAMAESPKAACLLGIPVENLFRLTSFVAAALGGMAGALTGLSFNAISPFMGQPALHKGIAVIILGGMGDIRGALIGGLFLGCVEVFSVAYLSSELRDAWSFGLVFLILLIRPSGLFGTVLERKA